MLYSYALIKKIIPAAPPIRKLMEAINLRFTEVESVHGDSLDIKIPPNRYSDASSHIGLAREISAIFNIPFKNPVKTIINPPRDRGVLKVTVMENKLCPRYAARIFEIPGVRASSTSMQRTLKSCGLQPINNIVDLMNYVMLETGQPLHAFDADRIIGAVRKNIIIRKARKGEKLATLDDKEILLDKNLLVIADEKYPLALAGIKGGKNSGVTGQTRRIIVEAANFNAEHIMRTSRELKLTTDASIRFSHNLSPALVDWGLDRVSELLRKEGAVLKDSKQMFGVRGSDEIVLFDLDSAERLLGNSLKEIEVKRIFNKLGFTIRNTQSKKRSFLVRVPSWRNDIENPEGLIEEVGRLMGYELLQKESPMVTLRPAQDDDCLLFEDKARHILVAMGYDEIYTTSFVPKNLTEDNSIYSWQPVTVANPISQEGAYLRSNLILLAKKYLEQNIKVFKTVDFFEIGHVFGEKRLQVNERISLVLAKAGENRHIYLELKGVISELILGLGIAEHYFVERKDGLMLESNGHVVGLMKYFKPEKDVFMAFAELDLSRLLELSKERKEYRPISKYPSVMRDISILVKPQVKINRILEVLYEKAPDWLEDVELIDEYFDASLKGKKSLTFRLIFQAEDRTLTDEEVSRVIDNAVRRLQQKISSEIR